MSKLQTSQTNGQAVRLLSTSQAATYLGVSSSTIKRLTYCGELPVLRNFKHWRFDVHDLDEFISRKKILM